MRPSRNSTRATHARYVEQAVANQLRREIAARYPTQAEQDTDEARRWQMLRNLELRKAAGV